MKNYYRHTYALKVSLCLLFPLFTSITTYAQDAPYLVTGRVQDETAPLAGVNIILKHKNKGTISDLDGRFAINTAANDTLVFSFLGYTPQEIPIGGKTEFYITMEPSAQALDQVVINAGYYKVSDKEKTGSITRITATEIENQPVSNPLAAMQGRMAGVNIVQSTGVPGGGFSVRIRGRNSIRADGSEPLYIVDGVPYPSQSLGNINVSNVLGNSQSPLNGISPNDIESIEVLKDADATAIYGSRGANGVVLITTKMGKSGKTRFQINTTTGVGSITRDLDLLNTEQYLAMRREAFANDGITEYPFNAYDVNGTWSTNRYTDWQEELLGGTAYYNTASASVQGGDNQTRFLLRGGYEEQTTVFPGDFKYKKGSALLNLNHSSPNNKFTLQFNGNYVVDNNKLPPINLVNEARNLPPNAPSLYDANGDLNWEDGTFTNPLAQLNGEYLSRTNTLLSSGTIAYRPLKGLEIKTNLGFTTNTLKETKTSPHTIYNPDYGLNSSYSSIIVNEANRRSYIVEPQLNYKKSIGKGNLNLLLGSTIQKEITTKSLLFAQGFSSNSLIYNPASAANIAIMSNTEEVYNYRALFGRLNFNWNHKYIVNLTGRRDGSSRFGPGNQYANFGAIGAAWIFSKEELIKNKLSFLSFGKLRGSYGTTGNDQIGNYGFLDTYTSSGLSYQGMQGLIPVSLFNPHFGWETNKKLEGAIELGLLKDKINLSASYYQNRSSNQLVGIPLPGTTGFSTLQANLPATVENTGWEFELATTNFQRDNFSWKTFINISLPRNKLLAFPNLDASTYANQYIIGEPLDILLLYNSNGVDPETGIYTFEDVDGDDAITKPNDLKTIANLSPKYFGGIQNTFTYANLSLDFLVQFVKQQGRNFMANSPLPGTMANQSTEILNHWQQQGDNTNVQLFTTGLNQEAVSGYVNNYDSDSSVGDASFIRLKNISLSYTIPTLSTLGVDCRVYALAQNLLTFTKYKGPDPETQIYDNLPPLKLVSIGLELTL
ncbi:SusC/RagA family TonB-linked outer membrane protein [Aequorivita sp. F47161]|uniref:SusC/RagA family TonB-linked outer membrane protein n=1 Tax=Aequorivita vitellina TaxID=2874475 RepID=A0A9X1UAM2_9FLAO|nr:SusC/RagA family TonB-linked outer membrane protein [Aequorivita vitellina]MCG2419751.1 SusC/RagA family TonB-linked outer membrane protein [Aequorivita vitellina]